MTQETVNFLIPFKTLAEAISGLSLEEKRHLWQLLAGQIAKAEAQTKEQPSTAQTEIQETRVAYQAEDDVSINEHTTRLRHEIMSLLDVLPESKLAVVFDLVHFLAERESQTAWMNAQSQATVYQEWVGSDNDIYNDCLKDALAL
jgi:hypothetical protein